MPIFHYSIILEDYQAPARTIYKFKILQFIKNFYTQKNNNKKISYKYIFFLR